MMSNDVRLGNFAIPGVLICNEVYKVGLYHFSDY